MNIHCYKYSVMKSVYMALCKVKMDTFLDGYSLNFSSRESIKGGMDKDRDGKSQRREDS